MGPGSAQVQRPADGQVNGLVLVNGVIREVGGHGTVPTDGIRTLGQGIAVTGALLCAAAVLRCQAWVTSIVTIHAVSA